MEILFSNFEIILKTNFEIIFKLTTLFLIIVALGINACVDGKAFVLMSMRFSSRVFQSIIFFMNKQYLVLEKVVLIDFFF